MFHENLESASRVLGLGQESGAPPPVLFGAIGNWARGTCVTATISSCPANRSGIRPQHSTQTKEKTTSSSSTPRARRSRRAALGARTGSDADAVAVAWRWTPSKAWFTFKKFIK